jgi:RIO kinase 1
MPVEHMAEAENSSENPSDFDEYYDDQWFETNGDLTKKFNRMRQQVATLTTESSTAMSVKGQILNRIEDQKKLQVSNSKVAAPSAPVTASKQTDIDDVNMLNQRYAARIKLDANDLFNFKVSSKKEDDGKYLIKDKSDRATVEQVLDPRTKMILFKMLNRDIIYEINGCISTGKEVE